MWCERVIYIYQIRTYIYIYIYAYNEHIYVYKIYCSSMSSNANHLKSINN